MSRTDLDALIYLADVRIDELEAENAKLRELLRDTLIHPDQYCDKYGIEREYGANKWNKVNDDIDRRLRELGFTEVDE